MGKFNKAKFKQIMLPIDVYQDLASLRRRKNNSLIESFGELIRRILDERRHTKIVYMTPKLSKVFQSPKFSKSYNTPKFKRR